MKIKFNKMFRYKLNKLFLINYEKVIINLSNYDYDN